MIVADTSALISLITGNTLALFLDVFDVHTTETVLEELRDTAEYDDAHAVAADTVLAHRERLTLHAAETQLQSSRVDHGKATCVKLSRELGADFLITDDLQALPELQELTDSSVAISPIVLKALVKRNELTEETAKRRLETIAETRSWLGRPIYRRAQNLFE